VLLLLSARYNNYGFTTSDVTEARYKAFMRMSGDKGKDLLAGLKKINCDSLPPCAKTLHNHIKRAQYVARMWRRANETNPTDDACPTDYGWKLSQNRFEPCRLVPRKFCSRVPHASR
jgi:hypothetical protein